MAALDDYDWTGAADEIEALMRRYYPDLLATGWNEAAAEIPGIAVSFNLSNPYIKDTINRLGKRIRGVSDTTKDDVQRLVDLATEQGWSPGQLAEQIRGMGEINSKSRAMLISRTEGGTAYNLGAVGSYRAAGLTHVDIMDGDKDEICASVNGTRQTLEWLDANPLGHPNCTRAALPVVE